MSARLQTKVKAPSDPKPSSVPMRPGLLRHKGTLGGTPGPTSEKTDAYTKQSASQPPLVQAKLTINDPGDKYEQEADWVAEQVMRMPEPRLQRQVTEEEEEETLQAKPLASRVTPLVQRQVEPEEEEEEELLQAKLVDDVQVQRQEEEEEEEEPVQTKPVNGKTPWDGRRQAGQVCAPKGSGQLLPRSVRNFFEPRFGYDFSKVRIYADSGAAEAARTLNAKAYTHGRNIVFGAGQYAPETASGRHLLAHELSHVVQQEFEIQPTQRHLQRQPIGEQSATAEREREVEAIKVEGKNYVLYQKEVRTGGSSSWLANNPGNLDYTADTVVLGAYEGKYLRWGKHRFAIFTSEREGLRAVRKFLRKHQQNPVSKNYRDIRLMMNLFAPASDSGNKPSEYASRVAKALNVSVYKLVKDLSDDQIKIFAKTIQDVEGWKPGKTYDRDSPSLPPEVRSRP